MQHYSLFTKRLRFRNWNIDDLTEFAAMNSDPQVMQYFPKPLSEKESEEYIERLQAHYKKYGYNYFATEIKSTGELIGFIGLANQVYESPFTPAVDIGWRLKSSAWGKGYATEGARRCLQFAFEELKLQNLISTCPVVNTPSENVMKKIGMTFEGRFKHPRLKNYPELEECVCYGMDNQIWQKWKSENREN